MILCDTGPLVAAADRDDDHNRDCTDLFTALHLARRQILGPAPVVAEVGYLLGRSAGPYGDLPLGATDAAVVAVAERLHVTEVATLDHRHFRAVRPRHAEAFALLP